MYYRKIQGLYIIEFGNGIKIGRTKDCIGRMNSYLMPWCRVIRKAEYIACQFPNYVEWMLKQKFKGYIRDEHTTEFFSIISYDRLKEFITKNLFYTPDGIEINRHFRDAKWITYK